MMKNELADKFRFWQKSHANFMTPEVVSIQTKGNRVVEISKGTGIEDEPIFGCSEMEFVHDLEFKTTSRGKMFFTLEEAKNHAKKLMGDVV